MSLLDDIKAKADQNSDGKLSLDDAKNLDFGSVLNDIKGKFF